MTNQTCPHCGADTHTKSLHVYKCGTGAHPNASRKDKCYQRQLAAKDAEIERLKQAILNEREACIEVCKYLSKGRGCFVEEVLNETAQAIRARGEK